MNKETKTEKMQENSIGAHIENVHIENTSSANEHTRAAIEALSNAIAKNAEAIIETARALKGCPSSMENGIYISHVCAKKDGENG